MNLTANFSLHELTKSETALRLNIENAPDSGQIESLRLLCEKVLQPIRDHFGKGVKVNSGFRSLAVNAALWRTMALNHPTTPVAWRLTLKYPVCQTPSLLSGSWTI
jgi:zinc D-Ala-D-Ala carboxypeptidase